MTLAYIIETSTLYGLLILNFITSLIALIYEVVKSDAKLNWSNILWGIVLFGIPLLGIVLYVAVKAVMLTKALIKVKLQ